MTTVVSLDEPNVIEVYAVGPAGAPGPIGPAGQTGVVAAVSPIVYTAGTQTVSFDPTRITATTNYVPSLTLDLAALNGTYQTITLSGDLNLSSSNRAAGRNVVIRFIARGGTRTLNFPNDWVFLGPVPTSLAVDKTAICSIIFFGPTDADAVCIYAVQP